MKYFIIKWIVALFIIFSAWAGWLYALQEQFIFYPSSEIISHPIRSGLKWEPVSWKTTDGETLQGNWMENEGALHTVVYFHGNGGNISILAGQMYVFQTLGVNALIFDYRGFGESSGKIKREFDLYEDGKSAIKFLEGQKHIPLENMIFWGQSLGTGVATELAQNQNIAALILDFPFLSLPSVAQMHYPFLPMKFLMRYKFDNAQKIKNVHAPVMMFFTKEDEIIASTQAPELFALANNPKELVELTGTHNRAIPETTDKYVQSLHKFFEKNFEGNEELRVKNEE